MMVGSSFGAPIPSDSDKPRADTNPHPGLAQLFYMAKLQSANQLGKDPPGSQRPLPAALVGLGALQVRAFTAPFVEVVQTRALRGGVPTRRQQLQHFCDPLFRELAYEFLLLDGAVQLNQLLVAVVFVNLVPVKNVFFHRPGK